MGFACSPCVYVCIVLLGLKKVEPAPFSPCVTRFVFMYIHNFFLRRADRGWHGLMRDGTLLTGISGCTDVSAGWHGQALLWVLYMCSLQNTHMCMCANDAALTTYRWPENCVFSGGCSGFSSGDALSVIRVPVVLFGYL